MRKTFFLFVTFFISYNCFAQLTDNKFNIYVGYSSGGFHGQQSFKEGDYISSSLFAGFKHTNGSTIKGLIEVNPLCSVGLGVDAFNSWGWKNPDNYDFLFSKSTQSSIFPTIQLHTRFGNLGFSNRVKLFAEFAFLIGKSDLKLGYDYFVTVNKPVYFYNYIYYKNCSDVYYGARGSFGLEIVVNHYIGIFANYSLQQCMIKSKFFNDKQFNRTQIDCGLFLRLKKDKHFFYR